MAGELPEFLSHLCGDEEGAYRAAGVGGFLSHLCGDEVPDMLDESIAIFLSHLCGDEDLKRNRYRY